MSGSETFVLEFLPARGLDQSMLLPVLIGLLVVLFFTETFGWVFAGAVVPGYLASVLIIQPVTGAIVIFESLVTLALAAAIARALSETDAWSRFFGRERFFLILAVSLIVRIHDHAWFAPWAIAQLDAQLGTTLETQQEFYSVGLVLVPLTANMLWKPAIQRGILQLAVQVGITYLIVRYILLPYTNLTLSSVELTYENAAINFIGHAKAHIILLTAALLAAQFNLTYGWDFNGILVPALLAMLWLTPLKLFATVGEAIVVLYLVKGFLRLPGIRHLDFEGPRKITMVFTLAFVWKLALGFTLAPLFPELKISDTYGFGYLLSSLLAVKMLGRKSVRAVLLPSLTASAGGFAIGSMIGFALDLVAPQPPPTDSITRPASSRLVSTPLGVMTLARMHIDVQREDPQPPTQAELRQLQMFWADVVRLGAELGHGDGSALTGVIAGIAGESTPAPLDPLRRRGAALGLQIVELGSFTNAAGTARAWYGIVEQDGPARRGFASGLVIPDAAGPVLVVPMPASEAPVAEAAAIACRRVDCRAVLVAGRELGKAGTGVSPRPIEIAMQAFEDAQIVILRADAAERTTNIVSRALPLETAVEEAKRTPTRIHPLRGYFDLVELWPDYELDWEPREILVRPPDGDGDLVLVRTTVAQLEQMVLAEAHELVKRESLAPARAEEVELLATLAAMREHSEPPGLAGSGYVPPSTAELSLLEQEVVEPLVDWSQRSRPGIPPPPSVALWAAELDYELVELGDCGDRRRPTCAVMLRERERPSTAGWGTLVLRRGPDTLASTIEVPRPHREFETWRVGAELWQISEASALLIAGADGLPQASRRQNFDALAVQDPSFGASNPDPVRPGNLSTPFQAFHQAIDRSSVRGRAGAVVQIRGLASYRQIDRDIVVGLGQPGKADEFDEACWAALDERIAGLVRAWGSCRIADGSGELYLLSGAGVPQLEYSRELRNREVRVMWLSAGLRERFRTDRGLAEVRALRQAGFDPQPMHETEMLLAPLARVPVGARIGKHGFDRAVDLAVEFAETGNLHVLRELRAVGDHIVNIRVTAGLGLDWSRPFLLIEWTGDEIGARALVSLDHLLGQRVELSLADIADQPIVRLQTAALARPQVLILNDLTTRRNLPKPESRSGGLR